MLIKIANYEQKLSNVDKIFGWEVRIGIDISRFNIFNLKSRIQQVGGTFFPVNNALQDFSPLVNAVIFGI